MDAMITCICGKENKLKNGRSKKCRCGAVLSIRGEQNIPYATIPESNLNERKRRGKKVTNNAPKGRWL